MFNDTKDFINTLDENLYKEPHIDKYYFVFNYLLDTEEVYLINKNLFNRTPVLENSTIKLSFKIDYYINEFLNIFKEDLCILIEKESYNILLRLDSKNAEYNSFDIIDMEFHISAIKFDFKENNLFSERYITKVNV